MFAPSLKAEASMRARPNVLGILTVVLSAFLATESRAESQQAVDKIVALNKAALASFGAGDHEKAKTQLMDAVVLGKENGLGMHAAMARTYLHLGVVYVDGLKDKEKGQRYFTMAQKVRPDIELTPALASKTVTSVFEAAKGADAGKAEKTAKSETKSEVKSELKTATKAEPKPEAKPAEKVAKAEEPKAPAAAAPDKKKDETAAKERDQKVHDAQDKLQKELAQARDGEKKERAEKERLQKELAEKDKQLADANAREKKEREARERLEKLNQENGKLIAEASGREKKEREAREKLEKEKQLVEMREKDRKDREEKDRAAREKLVEGPDLPASIPQPLFCATKDEGTVGVELFVHCVPQAQVKAKSVVLYFRPSGVAHFDAVTMARSKKGWWTASVPASRVNGKTLQYYVEARGLKDEGAATNGKADSPNIMTLRAASDAVASKAAPAPEPLAKAAPAKASTKAPTKAAARRTSASKRVKARR
jgi:chemotaxis protein histidine kinase CheA